MPQNLKPWDISMGKGPTLTRFTGENGVPERGKDLVPAVRAGADTRLLPSSQHHFLHEASKQGAEERRWFGVQV